MISLIWFIIFVRFVIIRYILSLYLFMWFLNYFVLESLKRNIVEIFIVRWRIQEYSCYILPFLCSFRVLEKLVEHKRWKNVFKVLAYSFHVFSRVLCLVASSSTRTRVHHWLFSFWRWWKMKWQSYY